MEAPHASFHEIMPRLMPFQREGVEFALRQRGRVLIGDEMGLGKTLQAIAVAVAYRAQWPALIVVPASLKYSWADELEKWVPRLNPWDLCMVKSRNDVAGLGKPLVLATYGMFTDTSPVMNHFREHPPRLVIVDECHALKSRDAARTKALVPLLEQARHCVLLSGTPALARPAELFTQVGALRRDLFGKSFWAYAKRYCNARRRFWGMDTSGASNLDELHEKLQEVMVRRMKRDVLQQLPAKRRQRVRVELSAAQRKLVQPHLDAIEAEFATLRGGPGGEADLETLLSARHEARRLLMAAYKATGEAKLPAVRDYVRCTLEGSDGKVLVFAYHRAVVQGLAQMAARARVGFIRIDGDTPTCDRQEQVRRFQDDPAVRLAVLSMTAAGQGLTLTAASTVLFAELHWTPGVLVQAEDRAHRIGQECAVNVSYLVAKNSLDAHLWRCLARKVGVVTAALDGKRQRLQATLRNEGHRGEGDASRKRPAPGEGGGGVADLASFAADTAADGDSGTLPPAKAARGGVLWFFHRQRGQQRDGAGAGKETEAEARTAPSPAPPLRCGACQRAAPNLRPARIVGWDGAHLCSSCASTLGAAPAGGTGAQTSPPPPPAPGGDPAEVVVVDGEGPRAGSRHASPISPGATASRPTPWGAAPAPYWFCVSQATGRAFLFDGDQLPLHASFGAEDMSALRAGGGAAPPSLRHVANERPAVLAACRAFVEDWTQLRAAERSALAGTVVRPPLRPLVLKHRAAAEKGRVSTTERYAGPGSDAPGVNARRRLEYGATAWREEDVAPACDECGTALDRAKAARLANTSRTPPPPRDAGDKGRTGVCEDGQFALDNLSAPPSHWWTRFCGLQCYRLHCLRRSGPEIRRQLFALERGVCQLCGLDAHALFERVRALAPPERLAELKNAGFSIGTGRKAGSLLSAPKEGDLWQADHEVPVAEGGGACAIFNFRTLCTPCHQRETARLRQRLKAKAKADAARGTADIRTLFGGATIASTAQ